MKKLLLITAAVIMLAGCSSRNIKLDRQYLSGSDKCAVKCKYDIAPTISSSSDGLIAMVVDTGREKAFISVLTNLDLRPEVKSNFIEKIRTGGTRFEVIQDAKITEKTDSTTNYQFLATAHNVPFLFELRITKWGCKITSGALGIFVNYTALLKVEAVLKDLKNNKVIWLCEEDVDMSIPGNRDKIIADDGKVMKETFSALIKKVNQRLVDNLNK